MTNFGARAILALPKMPERQLRLLLALETFSRREDGWREAGTELLASTAGLSVKTTARARVELVKSGAIEYRRGNGRRRFSTYRLKVVINDVPLPEPGKVPSDSAPLSGAGKVPSDSAHLSGPGKVVEQPRKGTQTGSGKVPKRNPATSGNASGELEPHELEPSSSRRTTRTGSRGEPAATGMTKKKIPRTNVPEAEWVCATCGAKAADGVRFAVPPDQCADCAAKAKAGP